MNIIDFGGRMPSRKHTGDAGADVYILKTEMLFPHKTACIPLGIGTELPEGCVGFILPRSSMAARGVVAQAVPIDSNYRGELHAIVTNTGDETVILNAGDRIAQLVIFKCEMPDFAMIAPEDASVTDRGACAFGSTGK